MLLEITHVRLTEKQVKYIIKLVESGEYGNKSEVIRDAVTKFLKEHFKDEEFRSMIRR